MRHTCFAMAATLLIAAPALAEEQSACALDYETYETAVPHNDLESCPDSMELEGAYCRVSLSAEIATVVAFSEQNDCIVASRAYFPDEYTLTLD